LLASENYEAVLGGLREQFAFTIIDAPPILDSIDVGHIGQ